MTGKRVGCYCPLPPAEHWFYWAAPSCDCVYLFACRVHIFTKRLDRISHAEMWDRCCCTITVTQLLYSKSQQVLQQMTSSAQPGKIQRLFAPHTNSHHLPLYCILCLQKASHNLKWQAPVSTFPPSLLIPPPPLPLFYNLLFFPAMDTHRYVAEELHLWPPRTLFFQTVQLQIFLLPGWIHRLATFRIHRRECRRVMVMHTPTPTISRTVELWTPWELSEWCLLSMALSLCSFRWISNKISINYTCKGICSFKLYDSFLTLSL